MVENPENAPQWFRDAEDMDFDIQSFITDFFLESEERPVGDKRITEEFTLEIIGAACCADLNSSVDFMLRERDLGEKDIEELGRYLRDKKLPGILMEAFAVAQEKCNDKGLGWDQIHERKYREEY